MTDGRSGSRAATKIAVEHVSKVFGDEPEAALALLEQGRTKDEILNETGQTVGVQDVSFEVGEGEVFVVMGLSGSGKSTLVRILNRLIPATAGRVLIDGEDLLAADERAVRQTRLDKMSMVFQHFALFPHKTVRENVEYGLKVKGVGPEERRERATEALDRVGLAPWAERRPDALSGGMQQRVGLARGLAVETEILLMDEPFSALDPLIRREMQNELLRLQRELRKTIVFITHDLLESLILGDRIAIMKEGRFVQVGTAEGIVGAPADDYVAAFTQDIDRSRVFPAGRAMDEALALGPGETAATARERMREAERDALHVVDRDKAVGVVRYRDLAEAEPEARVVDLMRRDFPVAAPDTRLYRLFPLCRAGLPIAVADERERLLGVIEPGRLFEQLAGTAEEDAAA
jgi:glycine betaine/proline transport system ATP-binding protein